MMTFLLQFFLNHQLINLKSLFQWFYGTKQTSVGFQQAKQLAQSFVDKHIQNAAMNNR